MISPKPRRSIQQRYEQRYRDIFADIVLSVCKRSTISAISGAAFLIGTAAGLALIIFLKSPWYVPIAFLLLAAWIGYLIFRNGDRKRTRTRSAKSGRIKESEE
jgi:uncharacterized membrane protein